MKEKDYSQKVANVFEIIGYFLSLPALVGVLVVLSDFRKEPLIGILFFAVLAVGVVLLVGYYKRANGRLHEKYHSPLWLTTAALNFLLLLPWLYMTSTVLQHGMTDLEGRRDTGAIVLYLLLVAIVFSYIAAVVFSLKAYAFDKRKKLL